MSARAAADIFIQEREKFLALEKAHSELQTKFSEGIADMRREAEKTKEGLMKKIDELKEEVKKWKSSTSKYRKRSEESKKKAVEKYINSEELAAAFRDRYDGGWWAAYRCVQAAYPGTDWALVEGHHAAGSHLKPLNDDDVPECGELNIANANPSEVLVVEIGTRKGDEAEGSKAHEDVHSSSGKIGAEKEKGKDAGTSGADGAGEQIGEADMEN